MKLTLRLLSPALLFALAILIVIVYQVIRVGDKPGDAAFAIQESVPLMILLAQLLWLLLLLYLKSRDSLTWTDLGWKKPQKSDSLIAIVCGLGLAAAYVWLLSPAHTWLQRSIGDYVPAGGLISSLGSMKAMFFVANVLFAPFVEETIFRGYALPRLIERSEFGVLWSCLFFGLIHWAGGFWYMILTGAVAGGLFAFIYLRNHSTTAAWLCHLSLNAAEFAYVAWRDL